MFAPGLSKCTSRACIPVCRFSSGIPWYGIPPEFYGFFSGIPPDFCKFYKIPYSAEFQKKSVKFQLNTVTRNSVGNSVCTVFLGMRIFTEFRKIRISPKFVWRTNGQSTCMYPLDSVLTRYVSSSISLAGPITIMVGEGGVPPSHASLPRPPLHPSAP